MPPHWPLRRCCACDIALVSSSSSTKNLQTRTTGIDLLARPRSIFAATAVQTISPIWTARRWARWMPTRIVPLFCVNWPQTCVRLPEASPQCPPYNQSGTTTLCVGVPNDRVPAEIIEPPTSESPVSGIKPTFGTPSRACRCRRSHGLTQQECV